MSDYPKTVYVLLVELVNGDKIPMGIPDDDTDVLAAYAAFAFASKSDADAELAELVAFNAGYVDECSIESATLHADGTLALPDRTWTMDEIYREHGVERPQPNRPR